MAPHTLLTLATLASLLLSRPCTASSPPDFAVPTLAIQGPSRLSPSDSSSASSQPLHAHLSRHRRRSPFSHDPRIEQRQVHNVRAAAKAWEKRDAVAKRASPSNVPQTGICLNSVGAYGQCGGLNYEGDTCCSNGWTCEKSDDYYSQCRPSTTSCTNAFYGQCGGLAWMGATCCPDGSACVSSGPYYAQCMPGASSSSSTTTTPAVVSTSSSSSSSSSSSKTTQSPSSPSSQSTSSSSRTTTTNSTTTTTSSTTTSRSSSTTSSSAPLAPSCSGSGVAWGQCGGQGWSGATCCPSGYMCSYSNAWYSQCVPGSTTSSSTTTTTTTSAHPTSATSSPSSSAFSTVTRSSSASSTSPTPTATPTASTRSASRAYGQCGGLLYLLQETCCPTGYTCEYSSLFYSQCLPAISSSSATSSTATSASRTSTSTSSAPTAASSGSCKAGQAVSDGCIIYTLTSSGITLPPGYTFQDNGHVNYAVIPSSQYRSGETWTRHGSQWTPQTFNVHFESMNGQPGGKYIGQSYLDFGAAQAAYPDGFCVVWVQLGGTGLQMLENPHYGEGGQAPVCT